MRNLIQSVLGTTAVLALVASGAACARSRDGGTTSGVQTQTPAAERVNPGSGYYGAAPENVNRPSTTPPTGMGGGPGTAPPASSMGIDQSGTDTEMTGDSGIIDQSGSTDSTSGTGTKKKSGTKSTDGTTEPTGGGEKGSGTTGGTQK